MIFYINGVQVSEKRAKAYFFEGHKTTLEWFKNRGYHRILKSASDTWSRRTTTRAQVQISNISGILDMGCLEIVND